MDYSLDPGEGLRMNRSAPDTIPTFYLYGEPQKTAVGGFIHVESLDDRSRPSEWTIQSHRHADLAHVILIESGGGEMQAEGFECAFSAPALLLIPAGYVHRFAWVAESRGHVVTIAQSYLAELGTRYDEVQRIFEQPAAIAADEATAAAIEAGIATLARELSWSARGRELAIDSALLGLLGLVVRQSDAAQARQSPPRSGALVARFRELADRRFRTNMSVADYARALGVGESTLRTSCVAVTSLSPGRIVAQRRLLEAQRLLLYSTLTVAQVAHAVGFSDPAYFSRFFTLQAGCPPSHFRK